MAKNKITLGDVETIMNIIVMTIANHPIPQREEFEKSYIDIMNRMGVALFGQSKNIKNNFTEREKKTVLNKEAFKIFLELGNLLERHGLNSGILTSFK